MYKLIRAFLFLFDPEKVHYFSMNVLRGLCSIKPIRNFIKYCFSPVPGEVIFFDLQFKNGIGLGAGFDKNAVFLDELDALGFGFVEIGTVTPLPQEGNEKPRLFRLSRDKALVNRMGFNNDGVEAVAGRLQKWRLNRSTAPGRSGNEFRNLVIGGNIGKNKTTPNEDAWKDYEKCFVRLHDLVDYFVVNVSSPNTPGLRELQEKESLRKIFTVLQENNRKMSMLKPIFLKIAPDLSDEQVNDVIDLALEIKLDGLVVSNTTIRREGLETSAKELGLIGAGGLSGLPVKERSTQLIRYIHQKTNGKLFLIGSGGIYTGMDAKEKLEAGASLVQVWTGFIYEGPAIVKKISRYLAEA